MGNVSENSFGHFWYIRHNQRRQEHLATLNLNIKNKSVLELGAGIGDHSSFFYDRNCEVLITDSRNENIQNINKRLPLIHKVNKKVSSGMLDMENPPAKYRKFQIVYSYGLLYHLSDPAKAINFMNMACSEMLLLESQVSFAVGSKINNIKEPAQNPTQSSSGTGCRPTREFIYGELKKHFKYVYTPKTQPNHNAFPIDWTLEGVKSWKKAQPRAIFVASRTEIKNALLVPELISKQSYHL